MSEPLQTMRYSADALFLMIGAVMIFSMHAGFAFLEAGSVRTKNQVNALVKIFTDWSLSTLAYFLIGFPIAYGISFWRNAGAILNMINGSATEGARGFDLLHCFFSLLLLPAFLPSFPAVSQNGHVFGRKLLPVEYLRDLPIRYSSQLSGVDLPFSRT
jgi:Amt family ammonium transporter